MQAKLDTPIPWLSLRQDEIDWFDRIRDGKPALWMCGELTEASQQRKSGGPRAGYLWHATCDGKVAVCSPKIAVDRDRNPYPHTYDRSCDTMTCENCTRLVRRTKMPRPGMVRR